MNNISSQYYKKEQSCAVAGEGVALLEIEDLILQQCSAPTKITTTRLLYRREDVEIIVARVRMYVFSRAMVAARSILISQVE